jgi:dihydroneopterin aldolase
MNLLASLEIKCLELCVFLGWPKEERKKEQVVLLDILIHYQIPPKACETDQLEDTVCYSTLVKYLKDEIAGHSFHLIEYLGAKIFHLVKEKTPPTAKVNIIITKHPPICGLAQGVRFNFGEN